MEAVTAKLQFILKKEDINRITIKNTEKGQSMFVDLHELKVKEARRLINNIIAVNNSEFNLELIHGYNHGTALKDMIQNDYENNRVVSKTGCETNFGRTTIKVKAA